MHKIGSFLAVDFTNGLVPRSDVKWAALDDATFVSELTKMKTLRRHSTMMAIIQEAKQRVITLQYTVFRLFVEKGIPPYYLEQLLTNRLLVRKMTGREYLTLIVNNRNEYLLKRELKANRRLAVPTDWTRGLELHVKYNKKRSAAYKRK